MVYASGVTGMRLYELYGNIAFGCGNMMYSSGDMAMRYMSMAT